MKTSIIKRALAAVCVIMVLSLAACGGSEETKVMKALNGDWVTSRDVSVGNLAYRFGDGQEFQYRNQKLDVVKDGRYTIDTDNKKIVLDGSLSPLTYSLNGSTLTLTLANGDTLTKTEKGGW